MTICWPFSQRTAVPELGWLPSWRRNALRSLIGACALALALLVGLLQPSALQIPENSLRDALLRAHASSAPELRVAVVDIDEAALQLLGPWPWPRERLADLVETLLLDQQAAAVALDVVLARPGDGTGDLRLAALAAHTPLVLAQVLDFAPRVQPLQTGVLLGGRAASTEDATKTLRASGYMGNHAGLAAARCVGHIGYVPERDGVLRHLPLYAELNGKLYPTLALALLQCVNAAPAHLPQHRAGLWRLPFTQQPEAFKVLSAAEVLQQQIEPGLLQGRLVLVGSSALALGDFVSTPLAALTPGVMVHAAATSALLDASARSQPQAPYGAWALLLWSSLTVALLLLALPRLPAWAGVALLCAMALGWLGFTLWLGLGLDAQWPVAAPLWAYAWLLLVAVPFEWWQSQRRSRRLLATLGQYVAPAVIVQIERQNLHHSLEPRHHLITAMVADMADYTRLTAQLPLAEAAALTKDFLSCLTGPVLASGGTLDRYSGDGLVAFWGAPLPCSQQADVAAAAALQMLEALQRFNTQRRARQQPEVRMRIGIESGPALVGDLGTSFRSTYTAVGDCINHAARLESAARDFGCPVLLGPKAAAMLQQHRSRSLGRLRLRNTELELEVFSLEQALAPAKNPPNT